MNVPEEIYKMILDNLHITYTPDDSTERRISNEIESGIDFIRKYCDKNADCSPGTDFGQMLCEYVLRAESGDLETFKKDYSEEIVGAKIEADVKEYAEAMGYA